MSFLRSLLRPRRRAVAARPRIETLSGPTMGTGYHARVVAGAGHDLAAIRQELQSAVDMVDATMSTWKPQSALSRFNAHPPGAWFAVPSDLASVVDLGLSISTLTGGAFDMCVGDSVNAWGFGPGGPVVAPPQSIASVVSYPDVEVRRSPPAIRKSASMSLDLSGIAKGYGVDAMADVLEGHGIADYVVDIDGEVRARGLRPDGTRWRVGLERPDTSTRAVGHILSLDMVAVATSGDYRRFFDADGARYSHTIDPRTHRPTTSAVASVTVADQSCAHADALATALLVMGETEGPAFANRNQISALFLIRHDGGLVEQTTHRFDDFL